LAACSEKLVVRVITATALAAATMRAVNLTCQMRALHLADVAWSDHNDVGTNSICVGSTTGPSLEAI